MIPTVNQTTTNIEVIDTKKEIPSNNNNVVAIEDLNIKKRKKPIFCQHVKWTAEEDTILRELIKMYGENDWRHLAKNMERRNPRQCRERWQNYLNPNLNIGKWTREEDELILAKREELGPKWTLISKFFVNRTDAMIKTRYNALVRNKKKNEKELEQSNYYNNFINAENNQNLVVPTRIKYFKPILINKPNPVNQLKKSDYLEQVLTQNVA